MFCTLFVVSPFSLSPALWFGGIHQQLFWTLFFINYQHRLSLAACYFSWQSPKLLSVTLVFCDLLVLLEIHVLWNVKKKRPKTERSLCQMLDGMQLLYQLFFVSDCLRRRFALAGPCVGPCVDVGPLDAHRRLSPVCAGSLLQHHPPYIRFYIFLEKAIETILIALPTWIFPILEKDRKAIWMYCFEHIVFNICV